MPRREKRPANPDPLTRTSEPGHYPLSVGQERLWWLRELGSAPDQYHIHGGWRFPKGLDPEAIATALRGLVRRHEILRTRFVLGAQGTLAQEVRDDVEIPITWAGRDWDAAVEAAATEPFDLARPPLFRVVGAELGDGPALYMALHHIVTDRWSMDVLPRDLMELYHAALEDRPAQLPPLPVQYGDYAAWQRRFLTGERLEALLGWWTGTLGGRERPELPLDRPRPATADGTGAEVTAVVSADITAELTALAWRSRATPFIVVTAALAKTLADQTGQPDVVVGAIVSDRPHRDLQDVVGFFVNTVPVLVDTSGPDLTFAELIVRTRDAWMAADAHQDAPFEEIVGALRGGTADRRNPVFDVAVNYGGDRLSLTELENAPIWWYPEVPSTARFDLSLTAMPVDGQLRVTMLYRPDLFERAPVEALTSRYTRLLELAVAAPDTPLRALPLTPAAEVERLHAGNDPSPAPQATVVELIEAQAAARPDAFAIAARDGRLSFRQLNERANRLARHLLTRGAGPERVVAVCLDHSIHRYIVLLAIAKAGAAYLPLDPALPAGRLRFLLDDAAPVLAVVSPSLRGALPEHATPVFEPDQLDLPGSPAGNPPAAARPGNLAYLISTSGSTGAPKSVAVMHLGLSRLCAGAPRYLDLGPGTTFFQAGPLSFDVAALEWAQLAHGGRVVVADAGTLQESLPTVVRDFAVTTLKVVSPQLDLLVDGGLEYLTGLRQLVAGGDVVNPKSFAAARQALPGCRVTASYGPTECTVLATVFEGAVDGGRVPIGRAVPHTRAYVLDRELNHAGVGMRGEIYLAGDGLARGYQGRPGLTADRFVPDPSGPPGARMYRTGDLGRYRPGGDIDFLGRADRQVKIRGFRIETSEIEHALLRRPGITSAVVVRAELDTGPCLAAYVVADEPLDRAELRGALRATLPAYMVPDHVIELPRLPLTANNKVDRAALPPVLLDAADADDEPASGLAARVVEAWSAVLGRPAPLHGDFFEQGGHSLLVPRATAAVRALLGREVPLRLMMEHRTPAAYADALLREREPDLAGASREHRLHRRDRPSAALGGDRRLDLFVSGTDPAAEVRRLLVVLDGAEFVDIMRLPAILDRLTVAGQIPVTAAVFISPAGWAARRTELLAGGYADVLADEVLPQLLDWLGERCRVERATALGASLGAVAAIRAALRRPDRFDGAAAISGPLTDHDLGADAGRSLARFYLAAGRDEADILLDDGLSLVEATRKTGAELAERGHVVRTETAAGGHTYAAWEAMLPEALRWIFDERQD
ncbi:non-ribosomal peptide synthetase [Dactylosporangium sp. CS-047395]|uniref:non-ribosomal peptide synthetase n=1 Tax=Dactylosporangium sp. CS-047395 TaxID=3239936 RepID=UPI003D8F2840